MSDDFEMSDCESEYEYDDSDYSAEEEDESSSESHNNNDRNSSGSHYSLGRDDASNPNAPRLTNTKKQKNVTMMPSSNLEPILRSRLTEVTEALGVSSAAAAPLLRNYKWSHQALLQNYFSNPRRVLERAGVLHRCRHLLEESTATTPTSSAAVVTVKSSTKECSICMEPLPNNNNNNNSNNIVSRNSNSSNKNSLSMACGHDFCLDCWEDYLTNCIQEAGSTCVIATCPQAGCPEVITELEVQRAAAHLMPKFKHFQLQSFVESNPQFRWCPGKDCDWVAQATSTVVSTLVDCKSVSSIALTTPIQAECRSCESSFCFGCYEEEPHPPVACSILQLWKEKNQNESETTNWVLVNTKSCPKCAARINKDGGCMYVRCFKCRHGFCWNCMGTHHVWTCNSYKKVDANEQRAKNELERYLHYYKRFHGHEDAQKFAQAQVDKLKSEEHNVTSHPVVPAVSPPTAVPSTKPASVNAQGLLFLPPPAFVVDDAQARPQEKDENIRIDLSLLIDANLQLVHCRRVLKHSYIFAFYRFANIPTSEKLKQEVFEHHQGILEGLTEGLSKVTELPRAEMDPQDIINRTRVIGQFIKNLLESVEKEVL